MGTCLSGQTERLLAVHVDVTGGRDSDKGHPMFEVGLLIISVSIAWSNHLLTNSFTMC